jgi:glycosyltransferase involved in cell wall biosynthesis
MMAESKRLAIVTCCQDDWGGSEELWSKSLDFLDKSNIRDITLFKNKVNLNHPEFKKLHNEKMVFLELDPNLKGLGRVMSKSRSLARRFGARLGLMEYYWDKTALRLFKFLKANPPHLVIISQGINFDGLVYAYQCLKLKIPYIIVAHKAVSFYWPNHEERPYMKRTLLGAKKCFFVSKHNQNLTEEQFGMRLKNGGIVVNPIKTEVKPLPYPDAHGGLRLACVGRIFVIDKGQDILLRIMAQNEWRGRDVSVTFYGSGPDKQALIEMAALLNVTNVSFSEFTRDMYEIWSSHHALILPSRSEGLPLTVIEAMALGRVVIATNAGGTNEIVEEGVTGFLGDASEKDFSEAMETAWKRRNDWESMGKLASSHIAATIPRNPETEFAHFIMNTLNER